MTEDLTTDQAVARAILPGFADAPEDERPIMMTRAVVIFEGVTSSGDRILCHWRNDGTYSWDAIGLLRTLLVQIEHDSLDGRCAD